MQTDKKWGTDTEIVSAANLFDIPIGNFIEEGHYQTNFPNEDRIFLHVIYFDFSSRSLFRRFIVNNSFPCELFVLPPFKSRGPKLKVAGLKCIANYL